MFSRIITLDEIQDDSLFLWGARQTGKSTLLKALFPKARYYDMLNANLFRAMSRNPSLMREQLMLLPAGSIVIIDEVQKVPELLVSIGFWKSAFIFSGYSISLDIIKIKNIMPNATQMDFKRG